MGTWELRVANTSGSALTGVWVPNNIAAIISDILSQTPYNNSAGPGSWLLRLAIDTSDILLDGITHVPFSGLPTGFRITSARIRTIWGSAASGVDIFLQSNQLDEQHVVDNDNPISPSDFINLIFDYDFGTFPQPTILDVVNNGAGLRLIISGSGFIQFGAGGSTFSGSFIISGDYEIDFFTYSLSPTSGSNAHIGQTIRITSDGSAGSLQLDQLTISLACGTVIPDIQTATEFVFIIPDSCDNFGPTDIVATGNGVQFSGDVVLGTLTILLANASGIYKLVKGKSNDTLYSGARDGTTYTVKIPNPFAKTGFIGG